jgi:hypothetical protein
MPTSDTLGRWTDLQGGRTRVMGSSAASLFLTAGPAPCTSALFELEGPHPFDLRLATATGVGPGVCVPAATVFAYTDNVCYKHTVIALVHAVSWFTLINKTSLRLFWVITNNYFGMEERERSRT